MVISQIINGEQGRIHGLKSGGRANHGEREERGAERVGVGRVSLSPPGRVCPSPENF